MKDAKFHRFSLIETPSRHDSSASRNWNGVVCAQSAKHGGTANANEVSTNHDLPQCARHIKVQSMKIQGTSSFANLAISNKSTHGLAQLDVLSILEL